MITLNAAQRLLKADIGGQPLSDSFGRHQMKRYAMLISKQPDKIKQNLGTSEGLTMYLLHDVMDWVVALYHDADQKCVAYGKLEKSPYSRRWRMYNLYVDKDWRGRRLANILHLGAVHVFKHLESDTTMAMGALKAFKSLERYGYRLKLFDTDTGKDVQFKWSPADVPMVNGQSIENESHYALYV